MYLNVLKRDTYVEEIFVTDLLRLSRHGKLWFNGMTARRFPLYGNK